MRLLPWKKQENNSFLARKPYCCLYSCEVIFFPQNISDLHNCFGSSDIVLRLLHCCQILDTLLPRYVLPLCSKYLSNSFYRESPDLISLEICKLFLFFQHSRALADLYLIGNLLFCLFGLKKNAIRKVYRVKYFTYSFMSIALLLSWF